MSRPRTTEGRIQHLAPGGAVCTYSLGHPGIFAFFGMGRGGEGVRKDRGQKKGSPQVLTPSRLPRKKLVREAEGEGTTGRSKSPRGWESSSSRVDK